MNSFKLTSLALLYALLSSSCSSVKSSLASAKDNTFKSLASVKEKAFGSSDRMKLTKVDPNRLLPANTQTENIRTNPVVKKQRMMLLAKNSRKKPSPAGRITPEADLPPLQLPEMPIADENDDGQSFLGILPALEGQSGPTGVEVKGSVPELPPLPSEEELAELELSDESA